MSLEATSQGDHWLIAPEKPPEFQSRWVGLGEWGKSWWLKSLSRVTSKPILAIVPSKAEARSIVDNFCFLAGEKAAERIHYLPALDFDFYRGLLPNPEILCERNTALFHALNDPNGRVFIATVETILQKVFPPEEYLRAAVVLTLNEEVDREQFLESLHEAGYQRQPTAYDPGTYSVRGGVIDFFSPLYPQPVRAEFFGDLVEELRFFDAKSQRSLDKIEKAAIIPVSQTLYPRGEKLQEASLKIKTRLDALDVLKERRQELILQLEEGSLSADFGFLFPYLSGGSNLLFDYFPEDTIAVWDLREQLLEDAKEKFLPRIQKSHQLYEKERTAIAPLAELFLSAEELQSQMDRPRSYYFENFAKQDGPFFQIHTLPVSLEAEREASRSSGSKGSGMLEAFATRFRGWMDEGYSIHIVSHTKTHCDRLAMLLEPYSIRTVVHSEGEDFSAALRHSDFSQINLWQGFITKSEIFSTLKLVVLSEEEIFGHKKRTARSAAWKSTASGAQLLSSFRDLNINDYVVHKDHGIGRYLGLKSMNFQEVPNDYVLLEYKDGDKLYIPVYRLNVLQKYMGGSEASVPLDKLGSDRWIKTKSKASKAIAELAAEFLETHAKRKLIPAHPFSAPGKEYAQFEMEFPFDETPDQYKAIEDVMHDLGRNYPMDRLICGDVGYGKTEVAMRAAYRAILDGKQVAVLVPTTVLAFQHFENFKNRFKTTAARIDMVCRLRSSAEIKQTIQNTKEGKVDILIGTHRLLSADMTFNDLGLVIVDEEHRFGVVHKERLKKVSESVHFLSMTATPIPRTLNMAMAGIKDVSIITTPPPDRLSVRTFVCRGTIDVITEAVQNELVRDGQVFLVHNRIESLYALADEIKAAMPKLKFEVVHGQVEGDELEKKMLGFYRGEFQLLLTTAIIESGLDVPRANTMIIDRADILGLAQLYQLRGRVGRSDKRAYCYLLVPGENQLTPDAKQRLQVIQRYTDLGSGFSIASHDLEIRGAGDLLGKSQSGHLNAIGIDLYFELLEESLQQLKGFDVKKEIEPEITMKIAAYFPSDYLPDISERVQIYRKLSECDSEEKISEMESEIRDRFGSLPEEVTNLLGLMNIKLHLKKLHVLRMSCGPKRTSLQFAESTPVSPQKIVQLIQKDSKRYSLTPDHKLVFTVEDTDWRSQLKEIVRLSENIGIH